MKMKMNNRGNEDRIPWRRIILASVALIGIGTMAVLAPNALQSLKMFGYGKRSKKKEFDYRVSDAVNQAVKEGLIICEENDGKKVFSLAAKGERRLLRYQLKELVIKRPKRWDGKWRVIIFDIKEKKRGARDWLREELRNLGFERLQNSVWVFPYDCEEVITLLKTDAQFGKDVLYMVADRVEGDEYLRKQFRL